MKSKISFCNLSAIRKNVTRFAPVWALYGVMWLLIFLTTLSDSVNMGWNNSIGFWLSNDWASSLQMMPLLNCGYAFLCAEVLFGDLYNSRMCNSLHALPLRREGWFCTHVLSGLGFSLLPNLVITLLVMAFSGSFWTVAPAWLLGMTLQYIFFFGVAVFSAYCVGNRFAMLLLYGLINGLSILVLVLLGSLYMPLLHGLRLEAEPFIWLCPMVQMCTFDQILTIDVNMQPSESSLQAMDIAQESVKTSGVVQLGEGWGYLALCALIGLLFMGLGLLVYRKRDLERAGDFLAVTWLQPVFLTLYCLCGGMAGYLFFSLFLGEETLFFLVVGLVIAWFTGKMLLERTVRVFGKKSWLGCGILVVAFLGSLFLTKLDPLGLTRWQPAPEELRSAMLWIDAGNSVTHTDPEDLQTILDIHSYGIQNPEADTNGKPDVTVYLEYTLKNGTTASRAFTVDTGSNAGYQLKNLLSSPAYVLETEDLAALQRKMVVVTTRDGQVITDHAGLLAALEKDCLAGNLAQDWAFHQYEDSFTYLEMEYQGEGYYRQSLFVRIYDSCEHTIAWLKQQGYGLQEE